MKQNFTPRDESCKAHSLGSIILLTLFLTVVSFIGSPAQGYTQSTDGLYTTPSWWIGGAVAGNGNFYRGSTHELNGAFTPPTAFHDGFGIGLYAAPTIEYHWYESGFAIMVQAGYDNRSGTFDQVITPCNCPADLQAKLSYLVLEPSLRFSPFKKGLFVYAGPRFAFNLTNDFVYEQGINPDFPEQIEGDDVTGEFSNTQPYLLSMQVGMGYDIPVLNNNHQTQAIVAPFVAFHPYFNQDPRTIETWNLTTLRVGAIVKFGFGKTRDTKNESNTDQAKEGSTEKAADEPSVVSTVDDSKMIVPIATKVKFTVDSPENIPDKRVVRETFPLNNYVFFDLGSTKIPARYVQLNKAEVSEFKEEKVELFTPQNLSGRSDRQMVVYYNVLNILGDRMVKNPRSTINLSGASDRGNEDGKMMAESVKFYLVSNFGIAPSRITTVGTAKPSIPSEQPGATKELTRLRQEDRRVSIESTSPELMMEYQSGPSAPLKPVEIIAAKSAPIESYVSFKAKGAREEFSSWKLEVASENGAVKSFGPFTTDEVTMPGKTVLGDRPNGEYKATMIGTTKKGGFEVRQDATMRMTLWTPPETSEVHKYSVVYGFNKSNTIALYDVYIRKVIVPEIPQNGTVIIHGHTDNIGDPANNKALSLARANDAKSTIQRELAAQGRTDVSFKVYGFGEDTKLAPFANTYPEERLYNRSVIIDLVPGK